VKEVTNPKIIKNLFFGNTAYYQCQNYCRDLGYLVSLSNSKREVTFMKELCVFQGLRVTKEF